MSPWPLDTARLFDQIVVDKARLRSTVQHALRRQPQITLRELLDAAPLHQGLAELLAYLELAHAADGGYALDGLRALVDEAVEVATAVLYLEAAYEDLDPTNSKIAERSARLAQRLEHVRAGGEPEPLEGWMEDLYRRVADRQTMGSVVDELRTALGQVESSLDQFFRNPQDKTPLRELPSQLAQMRGVFSVLGLDQPAVAALRMRASVEQLLVDDIDEASARVGIFDNR